VRASGVCGPRECAGLGKARAPGRRGPREGAGPGKARAPGRRGLGSVGAGLRGRGPSAALEASPGSLYPQPYQLIPRLSPERRSGPYSGRRGPTFSGVRTPGPTAERAIAESRLRSIINPARRRPRRFLPRRGGGNGAQPHEGWIEPREGLIEGPAAVPREIDALGDAHSRPLAWVDAASTTYSKGTDEPPATPAQARRDSSVAVTPHSDNDGSVPATAPRHNHGSVPATAPRHNDGSVPAAPRHNGGPVPIPPSFQAFRAALASQAPALDPGKPGLRVLLAVGALAVAVAAFFVWRSQPTPELLPPPTPISPSAPSSPTSKVTVHVAGKIRKPGVYLLPSGARVADAITAAGGVARGASTGSLNLARRLIDGEQIVVGATAGQATPGSPITDPATAVLDLNAATTDQLEQLPGVGEVLAARITEFRDSHGGFSSVEQLREVSGIGPRKFEEIKPKVRV
jgi:competence protein ComEA